MAKKIRKNRNNEQEEVSYASGNEIADELSETEIEPDVGEIQLSDIPIEEFLKNPKMSELSESDEDEETTSWCPICNEHTIFVDKTCTVCGFVKGSPKKGDDGEVDQDEYSSFDLNPEGDLIDEVNGLGKFDEEDGDDSY